MTRKGKLRPKIACEICGLDNKSILHRHHIIPRQDPRSTNSDNNLAILCPNCHYSVHTGELIIIGVYSTTDGTKTMWFKSGEEPPLPKEFWKVQDNPLVIMNGSADKKLDKKGEENDGRGQEGRSDGS